MKFRLFQISVSFFAILVTLPSCVSTKNHASLQQNFQELQQRQQTLEEYVERLKVSNQKLTDDNFILSSSVAAKIERLEKETVTQKDSILKLNKKHESLQNDYNKLNDSYWNKSDELENALKKIADSDSVMAIEEESVVVQPVYFKKQAKKKAAPVRKPKKRRASR